MNTNTSSVEDTESVTYRHLLEKVESLLTEVSASDVDLDAMVSKVEEGYRVIRQMRTRLLDTKSKIEKLRLEFEETEPTASEKNSV